MRKPFMFLAVAALVIVATAGPAFAGGTALDEYVQRPEPKNAWKLVSKEVENGVEIIDIELTSQTWRGIDWKHHLWTFRPTTPTFNDLGVLVVTGGSGRDAKRYATPLVKQSGATVVILDSIPMQPIWDMREDDLIAHTFLKYFESGETDWPLLFPMTKSAVKAMDAIGEFTKKEYGASGEVKRWVVSGASKRGWTTWLTATVDARVAGIAPIVFDNLNFEPQMRHQLAWWGEFSEQIKDYTRRGLQEKMSTERGKQLTTWVDPYTYRDRWQDLPKLLINASNDAYWTLEATNFYWDGIGKNKSILMVPNNGHGIRDFPRVLNSAGAFIRAVGAKKQLPKMEWTWTQAGDATSIAVTADQDPVEMKVWVARTNVRDFRKAKWESEVVDAASSQRFVKTFEKPAKGSYVAFFAEAVFEDDAGRRYTLSSQVKILGDVAPAAAGAGAATRPTTGKTPAAVIERRGKKAKLY